MSAAATLTEAQALELAHEREMFAVLEGEWNLTDEALRDVGRRLRACGLRISELERKEHGGDLPGYNPEGGAR